MLGLGTGRAGRVCLHSFCWWGELWTDRPSNRRDGIVTKPYRCVWLWTQWYGLYVPGQTRFVHVGYLVIIWLAYLVTGCVGLIPLWTLFGVGLKKYCARPRVCWSEKRTPNCGSKPVMMSASDIGSCSVKFCKRRDRYLIKIVEL